jgi:hypothetical protein
MSSGVGSAAQDAKNKNVDELTRKTDDQLETDFRAQVDMKQMQDAAAKGVVMDAANLSPHMALNAMLPNQPVAQQSAAAAPVPKKVSVV